MSQSSNLVKLLIGEGGKTATGILNKWLETHLSVLCSIEMWPNVDPTVEQSDDINENH